MHKKNEVSLPKRVQLATNRRKRNKLYLQFIFALTLSIVIIGCSNEYEKNAIGNYELKEYSFFDSSHNVAFTNLNLNSDKTFILEVDQNKYFGKWKVKDIQEFTLIYFSFSDGHTCEGRIDGNDINILNPQIDFYSPFVKKLVLKKVK